MDLRWMERAVCREPEIDGADLMYPDEDQPKAELALAENAAKAACARCTVATECLLYALARKEQYGIWGGKTAKERAKLLTVAAGVDEATA